MRRQTVHALLLGGLLAAGSLLGCGPYRGGATVQMSWSIVDPRDPDPLNAPEFSCEQKSVATVRIQLSSGDLFDFPCKAYAGVTSVPVPTGNYTIAVLAIGYNGAVLSQQSFTNRLFGLTDLGHVIFQVF